MRKDMLGGSEGYLGLKQCGAGASPASDHALACESVASLTVLPVHFTLTIFADAAPNCFCSTDPVEDSPETNIPPFQWPANISSREAAFRQLEDVVRGYEPGQAGIDGGGFDVVTSDPATGYLYAQFQSLKNGYVDDVEFATVGGDGAAGGGERAVQVRSSSRLGYVSSSCGDVV